MDINSAESAREFAHAWIIEASPVAAERAIKGCIESQRKCAGLCYLPRHREAQRGHEAAIAMLERILAAIATGDGSWRHC